ncbi:MAG TPA: hypothetical protein VGL25_11755 [Casimicrobiaceae bacterium]
MLTLIVPGLLAHGTQALATAPFQAFARYADPPVQTTDGIGSALCAALDLPQTTPLAPLYAIGAGLDVDDRYMVAATPVTLVADRDIVMLAGRVYDLRGDEAAMLLELINRHFADDGVQFVAPRPSTWFAQCERAFALATSPLDAAIGRSIYPYLPRGADASTWQRWQVEVQMLLHEHAVNEQRDAHGLLPVSSMWFWGNGRLSDVGRPALAAAFAKPDESGDLVRGLARHVGLSADVLPATFSPIVNRFNQSENAIMALASTADESAIERFGIDWLQPALAALESGRLEALRLIADGHGAAVSWVARRPSRFVRVTSRLRTRPFAIPAFAEE